MPIGMYTAISFLSTPSARRATEVREMNAILKAFLSTPSVRRATEFFTSGWETYEISIHALREEGDYMRMIKLLSNAVFLSTPSVRRATQAGAIGL